MEKEKLDEAWKAGYNAGTKDCAADYEAGLRKVGVEKPDPCNGACETRIVGFIGTTELYQCTTCKRVEIK